MPESADRKLIKQKFEHSWYKKLQGYKRGYKKDGIQKEIDIAIINPLKIERNQQTPV